MYVLSSLKKYVGIEFHYKEKMVKEVNLKTTECKIYCTNIETKEEKPTWKKIKKGNVVGLGSVSCDSRDSFCKKNGRLKSLSRAVFSARKDLNEKERGLIWAEYRKMDFSLPKSKRRELAKFLRHLIDYNEVVLSEEIDFELEDDFVKEREDRFKEILEDYYKKISDQI